MQVVERIYSTDAGLSCIVLHLHAEIDEIYNCTKKS